MKEKFIKTVKKYLPYAIAGAVVSALGVTVLYIILTLLGSV